MIRVTEKLKRLANFALSRKTFFAICALLATLTLLFFGIKKPDFNTPTSTVILAEDGSLLAASVASDQQYRFSQSNTIPQKYLSCVIEFEDKYFYSHPGVNPVSIVRAAYRNIVARRIVQGGSTITQQVVRLYRKGKNRTLTEKIIEAILAIRLEAGASKNEILRMYAANAPFGGNIVGLDAAAWRYYGRRAQELSWAESAALAVLPNAPAMVHPGKNTNALLAKRNRLLLKLHEKGSIDTLSYQLALQEPLPGEPKRLPQLAPHLLVRATKEGLEGKTVKTTVNRKLQQNVIEVVNRHHKELSGNKIHNAAVLVLDVKTNSAAAYVGNIKSDKHGSKVDIITSSRSTGSILKPLVYAAMLQNGTILPNTLVPDIPTQIGGYSPKNFNPGYDGAVPASRAIARSLNVPAVRMLQQFGVEKFLFTLQKLGFSTINRSASDYGLSLILGGAEATLWDLAGVYAGMARTLNNYRLNQSRYTSNNYAEPHYTELGKTTSDTKLIDHSILGAAPIYFCFEAMKEVARPDELTGWEYFSSSRAVAWKTGTSYGHRDAWAIGVNPEYVVAVWVGNASGEGRPKLTGVTAAAPIMFDVFALLPPSQWFERPTDDMVKVPICRHSGYRASTICTPVDSVWIPSKGLETQACPYHQIIHLNKQKTKQVTDKYISVNKMVTQSWFVLPPAMEWYYKSKNSFYKPLPPYPAGFEPHKELSPMALLYPRIENATLTIPRDFRGNPTEAIFEIAHRRENATIYWHLNESFIGQTNSFHKMALQPADGFHTLTLVDDLGNTEKVSFSVE
ncbi:MAG: penicillin-binding protein 1C [Bacteroidales bacterium]|nr:penicillin-binding protein 1C [Bacteroidales bacterium]MDY0347317.1 penicillin-binding protein 1C [Tenuifilaceae bacterium]